jgi:hypothetical protein
MCRLSILLLSEDVTSAWFDLVEAWVVGLPENKIVLLMIEWKLRA